MKRCRHWWRYRNIPQFWFYGRHDGHVLSPGFYPDGKPATEKLCWPCARFWLLERVGKGWNQ